MSEPGAHGPRLAPDDHPLTAAILVGGRNTRFAGKPKGLEAIGGRRMLDRVAEMLERVTGGTPLLVGDVEAARGWRPDLRAVNDLRPGAGSLGGLYTALVTAGGPVLCLAWDMPFVPEPLLHQLAEGQADYDAFLPESPGPRGVEPLCAAYGPACIDAIAKRLDAGDLRMVGFHEGVRIGRLQLAEVQRHGDPARIFWNVNTPEDLREARALWAHRESSRS